MRLRERVSLQILERMGKKRRHKLFCLSILYTQKQIVHAFSVTHYPVISARLITRILYMLISAAVNSHFLQFSR